jgi:hypothetical protein
MIAAARAPLLPSIKAFFSTNSYFADEVVKSAKGFQL